MTEDVHTKQVTSPEQRLYACVDNLRAIWLPAELLRASDRNIHYSQLSDDVFLGEGVVERPGMYRCVDGRFLGWMEWMIYSAKQRGLVGDGEEIERAESFVKLLKELTGLESVAVDIAYQKPHNLYAWVNEIF